MKQTAYVRVSTQEQSYDRQRLEFETYFNNRNIDPATVEFVEEKITSHTNFKQRAIYKVLKNAQPGDIVYACQLDRFGRSVQDVLDLVDFAMAQGVELVTLDGHTIENKTPMGRMILTMLAAFAEMERTLRAERCLSGMEAAKAEIATHGRRTARCSGREQTRFGNEKGTNETKRIMAIARESSIAKRMDSAIAWREQSIAVEYVRTERMKGRGIVEITASLGELYDMHEKKRDASSDKPNPYATPNGCKPQKGTVSRWCREMNPIAI